MAKKPLKTSRLKRNGVFIVKLIELWKPAAVSNAGELSSTLRFDCDLTDYFIYNRSCKRNYKEMLNGVNDGEYRCDT